MNLQKDLNIYLITDKAVRVLLFGGSASNGSSAGSGNFHSDWVRSASDAYVDFFTTVKLD